MPSRLDHGRLKILLRDVARCWSWRAQPVIRVGRLAGQYAKPRSARPRRGAPGGIRQLPTLGDLVSSSAFDESRLTAGPDADGRRLQARGGDAQLHPRSHGRGLRRPAPPEYWDLGLLKPRACPTTCRRSMELTQPSPRGPAVHRKLWGPLVAELARMGSSPSTGLNLLYESAQTLPCRDAGTTTASTHLPWLGKDAGSTARCDTAASATHQREDPVHAVRRTALGLLRAQPRSGRAGGAHPPHGRALRVARACRRSSGTVKNTPDAGPVRGSATRCTEPRSRRRAAVKTQLRSTTSPGELARVRGDPTACSATLGGAPEL